MTGPTLEGGERCFDFAEACVDLVGQFVGILIFGFELGVLGLQGIDRRLFLGGEVSRRAVELAQMMGVAEWKIDIHLDPLPALAGDLLGLGLQLRGDQVVEQSDILKPTAIVLLEEVAHDDAARLLIGVKADEQSALVGRARGAFRQHAADLIGLLAIGTLERFPDLLLARVIVRHRERHELVERHAVFGIDVEQLLRHGRQA